MPKSIVMERTGGGEVLQLQEQPVQQPAPGQVRVRVEAAGVNFIDTYFRTGAYPVRLPYRPGLEGAGVVSELGDGVRGLRIGDRVAWAQCPGSYATELVAAADQLFAVPPGVTSATAAAAMLQGMTAHYLVHGVRRSRAGEVALVHAAAGGTGLLLVQMLTRAGVRVIGTCSTSDKEVLAREAGAGDVIRYTDTEFAPAVRELTDGRGVDVVYDSVGASTFDGSLSCLRRRGLLVLFGQSSGPVPAFDLQRLNQAGSLFVTRPSLAHYISDPTERQERGGAVLRAVAAGKLSVRIGARFPLREAGSAQAALEGRRTTGKVLLDVA